MAYKERLNGRKFDETRKIEAKAGVIPRADGDPAPVQIKGPKKYDFLHQASYCWTEVLLGGEELRKTAMDATFSRRCDWASWLHKRGG